MKRLLLLVVVIGWVVVGWLWKDEGKQPTQTEAAIPRIAALDLIAAYEENAVAADARFKGTWDVEGEVTAIGKEILGRPYVILNNGVQCVFTAQDTRVAAMRKGSEIATRCKAAGKLVHIQMSDCR